MISNNDCRKIFDHTLKLNLFVNKFILSNTKNNLFLQKVYIRTECFVSRLEMKLISN